MQHKSFSTMQCPIARGLEHVGEWWTMLIMRDALRGTTRFDDFRAGLGVAPNILTKRLAALVEAGLLERRCYSERPPRYEYLPTPRGRDFRPVLLAMLAWGNRHFPPDQQTVRIVNSETGDPVDPVLVDPKTGRPVDGPGYHAEYTPRRGPATETESAVQAEVTR